MIWIKRLLAFTASLCTVVVLLIVAVQLVCFDKNFYHTFYQEYQLAQKENIREEDARNAIDLMVDYAQGNRDDMDGTIQWKNGPQPAFNEKEKSHMKDVRMLWQNAKNTGLGAAVLGIVCILILWKMTGKYLPAWLSRGYIDVFICLTVLLVFFGFWMWIDFTGLWIQFHHWFFSNDLWALDPFTDFMIVICPESLFFTMILKISAYFGIPVLLLALFSFYYVKKKAAIGFEKLSS